MKRVLFLLVAVSLIAGCDAVSGGGGTGPGDGPVDEESLDLTGAWARPDRPYPPILDLDAAAGTYRVDYWTPWSMHEQCTSDLAGSMALVTDSSVVLQGLHGLPHDAGFLYSDTLSYDAVRDVLVTSARRDDRVSLTEYRRIDVSELHLEPYCDDLAGRFAGTWTLSAMTDSTGDVLADWLARYPSFVLHIDGTGNGQATIGAADGTVYTLRIDILFTSDLSNFRIWLYGAFPAPLPEVGVDTREVDGGMELSFYGNEDHWNRGFNTSLLASTRFLFLRQ